MLFARPRRWTTSAGRTRPPGGQGAVHPGIGPVRVAPTPAPCPWRAALVDEALGTHNLRFSQSNHARGVIPPGIDLHP